MSYVGIILSFVFVNNFVFTRLLGICPFIGVSKGLDPAFAMGCAVTCIMTISAFATSIVYTQILVPLNIMFLQILTFTIIVVFLCHILELIMRKISHNLYKAIGQYIPLITAHCAVLGIAFINVKNEYTVLESTIAGCAAGLGCMLALILMSSINEKLKREKVPQALRGVPITMISAGLISLAFMAFDMAFLKNIVG